MKNFILGLFLFFSLNVFGAYQYNVKGNQGWLSFDSETTLSLSLGTTGKDKDHENFIDRGESVTDFGWYNLETGSSGSFNNGLTATFKETDKIGLYITDKTGKTYLSTKPKSHFKDVIWGKSKVVDGALTVGGGNRGSNGTHEYYVFQVTSVNKPTNNNQPTGQPLPGILATLLVGGGSIWYLKKRKELLK
jgi:hypothetical protein